MRIETRGPETGQCNICGRTAKLTEDHIPPKGVPRVGQAFLIDIHARLGTANTKRKARQFQRGVTYRSICSYCNTHLLGSRYDPSLVKMAKDVDRVIAERMWLPISLRVQPNRLMRSAVGHLIAHGIGLYRRASFFRSMSDYFLDEGHVLPPRYTAHAWLYPHNDQFVSQCVGLASAGRSTSLISVLKFYPICIALFNEAEPDFGSMATLRLDHLLCDDINAICDVELPVAGVPPKLWPEAPREMANEAVLHTPLSLGAFRP